ELEARVLRTERLLADRVEPDDELRVVVKRLHAQHGARPELSVLHARARPQRAGDRLIFILVSVCRRLFFDAAAASVGVRPELIVWEVAVVAGRLVSGGDPFEQVSRDLVDEPRGLARLVLAEHAPARRACEDEPSLGARHSHVTEPAFF